MIQTFTATPGAFLSLPALYAALTPLMGGEAFHVKLRPGVGQVDVGADSFAGVNLAAVQAAIDGVPTFSAVRRRRDRDVLETDHKYRALVIWIGQLHGKTPAEARTELRAILQGLP